MGKSIFSQNLKKYREHNNFSRQYLADKVGISLSTLGMYEQGRREPDLQKLISIAVTLHVSVDELLGYTVPVVREYEKYKGWLESGYGFRVGERFGEVFIWTGMPEDENEKGVPGYKVLRFVDKAAFCNFIEAIIESEKWQMRSRVASTLRMLIYKGDNISTAEVPTDILEKL